MQGALEEENLLGLLVRQLLFLTACVRVLLTPNLFFLVQDLRCIVPFDSVVVLGLMLLYALYKAYVVNVKAIANTIARLTILLLFRIYRVHDHFAVFGRWAREHCYGILRYVLQSFLGKVVQSLRHSQIRMFLDYAHEPIQIIERNEPVLIFVYVSKQKEVILKQLLIINDVELLSVG